jgi:hypothetical protein
MAQLLGTDPRHSESCTPGRLESCDRTVDSCDHADNRSISYEVIPWTLVNKLIEISNIIASTLPSQESMLPSRLTPCILDIELITGATSKKGLSSGCGA